MVIIAKYPNQTVTLAGIIQNMNFSAIYLNTYIQPNFYCKGLAKILVT